MPQPQGARGIGVNFASVLTREVFYWTFDNRRQIASYLGLARTPFQSGGMDRDRRINRAGNSRARKTRRPTRLAFAFGTSQRAASRHGSGTVLPRLGSNSPHRDCRRRMRGVAKAHRSTRNDHLHPNARLGPSVSRYYPWL
jgi:hypothetical protein